jgi:putative phosphoribosyl transferase
MTHRPFADRRDAGRRLADRLGTLRLEDPVVIGLPRGGMVVASEVAKGLGAPLDVLCVQKITAPDQPELALGAIDEDGGVVLNHRLIEEASVSEQRLSEWVNKAKAELVAVATRYRSARSRVPLDGRTTVLVDDGLTTGLTVSVAGRAVRRSGAPTVLLAVPVSPDEALKAVRNEFHEVICLETPPLLLTLDEWYQDFPQVSEQEVLDLLTRAAIGPRR